MELWGPSPLSRSFIPGHTGQRHWDFSAPCLKAQATISASLSRGTWHQDASTPAAYCHHKYQNINTYWFWKLEKLSILIFHSIDTPVLAALSHSLFSPSASWHTPLQRPHIFSSHWLTVMSPSHHSSHLLQLHICWHVIALLYYLAIKIKILMPSIFRHFFPVVSKTVSNIDIFSSYCTEGKISVSWQHYCCHISQSQQASGTGWPAPPAAYHRQKYWNINTHRLPYMTLRQIVLQAWEWYQRPTMSPSSSILHVEVSLGKTPGLCHQFMNE